MFNRPIQNIIITGNNLVSDNEIIEKAGIKNYPSIFSLNLRKTKDKIKTIDLIDDVTIRRNLKFQLKINVTELKIVCLNLSNNKILLSNGKYMANNNQYEGIPTLINYTPEDVLKKFATGIGSLSQDIISNISEIEYSPSKNESGDVIDNTRFLLKMNDGNNVYINTKKTGTLKYYNEIYASLKNKKGTLYLDSGNYDRYVFTEFGSE
jgi:cell division septal protein FtsQ